MKFRYTNPKTLDFFCSIRDWWGGRAPISRADLALFLFNDPGKCKNWEPKDYFAALILLFGKRNLEDAGSSLMRAVDKAGKIIYLPDTVRYNLLAEWPLYEHDGFIRFIRSYPDYIRCFVYLTHLLATADQSKKTALSAVRTFVERERKRHYLLGCEHTIERAWASKESCRVAGDISIASKELMERGDALIDDSLFQDVLQNTVDLESEKIHAKRFSLLMALQNGQKVAYEYKSYQFSSLARQKLSPEKIKQYETFYGDQFRQLLHQESILILEKACVLEESAPLFPYQPLFIDAVDLIYTYSSHGQLSSAASISDFCWGLFACGKAVIAGAKKGLVKTALHYFNHPIESAICTAAAPYVMGYQIAVLLWDIADIGGTYLCNATRGQRKLNDFFVPVHELINEVYDGQSISLYKAIEKGTELSVQFYLQRKTTCLLNRFFAIANQQASRQIKKWWHLREAAVTPEGIIMEATEQAIRLRPEEVATQFYSSVDAGKIKPSRRPKEIIPTEGPLCEFTPEAEEIGVKYVISKESKRRHIFEKPMHDLNKLIAIIGSQRDFIREVIRKLSGKVYYNQLIKNVIISLEGFEVCVRGRVMNGIPKLGTLFIKDKS